MGSIRQTLLDCWMRLSQGIGDRTRSLRAPRWYVSLRDAVMRHAGEMAWDYQVWRYRHLEPWLEGVRERMGTLGIWCADFARWIAHRITRATEPIREWCAARARLAEERGETLSDKWAHFKDRRVDPVVRAVAVKLPAGAGEQIKSGVEAVRADLARFAIVCALCIAGTYIWWSWRAPPPPAPSQRELELVRSFINAGNSGNPFVFRQSPMPVQPGAVKK